MFRILLAEDDRVMREYLTRALERAGYAVSAVDRGTEALPLLEEAAPLLAVLPPDDPARLTGSIALALGRASAGRTAEAVDELLGTVRVRHLDAYYDAGRIINPRLAHSQAIGGMVGGIGMALLEATELDHRDGRIVNANMADYLVPVNADITALDAEFLAGEDLVTDPLGVKGLAELVFVGVPAAVANAVFHATGRRVRALPIRIEDLVGRKVSLYAAAASYRAVEYGWFLNACSARRTGGSTSDP